MASSSTDHDVAPAARLPYTFAQRHGIALTHVGADHAVAICSGQPSATGLLEARRLSGCPLRLEVLTPEHFSERLGQIYDDNDGASRLSENLHEDLDLDDASLQLDQLEDLLANADEAPIIRFINALLSEAIRDGASDIHIEPFESRLSIRFRIDGQLQERLSANRALAAPIASRIKVMAKLDIAEKRLPQDGRISLRVAGRPVDVRLSTLPSSHGERLVLRLLDKQAGRLDLSALGMTTAELERVRSMIARPHGILLITGPTGSGKTTTLYGILNALNDGRRNILTVEDPVEYNIEGIGQTQVNMKVGMTFAKGLRAILRQDPDVVMVGEIRDVETAEIAVQASLTGHLVLSTLHTNTALGAVTRLRDMGIEPFLLGSSIAGVMAQRLVRRLCQHCRSPRDANTLPAAARAWLGDHTDNAGYQATGCDHCGQQGYQGRGALFEVVPVDQHLAALIGEDTGEQVLETHAHKHCANLDSQARAAVQNGLTSIEEALRVTRTD